MATWKKVIVSGSSAELAAVTSSLGVLVGTNQSITTSPSTTFLSGSFSGSFFGDGSGISGVAASFPATQKTDLVNTDKFFINDGASKYVTYGDLLTDLAGTNLTVEGTDSLTLASQIVVTGVTASFTGSLVGALTGTASFANTATSASFALTASYASNVPVTASFALTASNIFPAITNNVNNYILSATGEGIINGESNLSFDGTLLTVNGNTTITGDLTVAGTASFTNVDNLNIRDKFILINSGSSTLADSGWVTQYNAAGSGSAFYLEANSTGVYGRFAVAYDIIGTSTSLNADEYVVTARVSASAAIPANPTWGGSSNGSGNMFINSLNGDIYIYS